MPSAFINRCRRSIDIAGVSPPLQVVNGVLGMSGGQGDAIDSMSPMMRIRPDMLAGEEGSLESYLRDYTNNGNGLVTNSPIGVLNGKKSLNFGQSNTAKLNQSIADALQQEALTLSFVYKPGNDDLETIGWIFQFIDYVTPANFIGIGARPGWGDLSVSIGGNDYFLPGINKNVPMVVTVIFGPQITTYSNLNPGDTAPPLSEAGIPQSYSYSGAWMGDVFGISRGTIGMIGEIVAIPRALGNAERQTLITTLMQNWGV